VARRTRTIGAVALATLLACVANAGTASAAAPGGFSQLPNPLGCLSNAGAGGCGSMHDSSAPYGFILSPDGRNAYAASYLGNQVLIFDRNPNSGSLTQKPGTAGCVRGAAASANCASARFVDSPQGLAVSPDGRTLYVASPSVSTIAVFSRDTNTGEITQKPDDAGCIADSNPECRDARSLGSPYNIAISADGRNLYSASYSANAVVAMTIASDGTLSQTTNGSQGVGCIAAAATVDCQAGPSLSGPYYLTVAPDGTTVYVGGYGDQSVVGLKRDPGTGRLSLIGGAQQCADKNGTGAPTGCQLVPELGSIRYLVVDASGQHVYAAMEAPANVVVFDRQANGSITRHAGVTGCLTGSTTAGCTAARGLTSGNGLALSPDGEHLYLAGGQGVTEHAVASDGGLIPRAGVAACTTASAVSNCRTGTAMSNVYGVQVSPDGRFIYTSDVGSHSLQTFKRDSAGPSCGTSSVTVQAGSVAPIPFPCSDIDGDSFSTTIVAPPTLGSLGAIDNTVHAVLYAAPQNQNGTTSFTFRSTYPDGSFPSGVGTVNVTVVGAPGPVDADRDGFPRATDCNDNNAKINPLAKEIRGNKVDENCDGVKAPFFDIRSTVVPLWQLDGNRFIVRGLLLKNLIKGWKVTISCKGKGCPFKSKKVKKKAVKSGTFEAVKKLGAKRTFRSGNVITVKFTAPKRNTKFAIYTLKGGKVPVGKAQCQTVGTKKRRACR
jgi:6-phosphogluconolactonase (cycloisomerase 2 family)